MSNEYSYVQVQQQWGAERRFVSERSERGWPPVHFSSQNNPGGEFETTPQVSGDFLDYDPGREDPNSMPGYRDAEFEIPLYIGLDRITVKSKRVETENKPQQKIYMRSPFPVLQRRP